MDNLNTDKVINILNDIMMCELSGVVRYTHYGLMVTGPYRLVLEDFFKQQANESLLHAQQAGELLTSLGGHPTQDISFIKEENKHKVVDLLSESLEHESGALGLYNSLLKEVEGKSIYIEEYSRNMSKQEELHSLSIKKMLLDYE